MRSFRGRLVFILLALVVVCCTPAADQEGAQSQLLGRTVGHAGIAPASYSVFELVKSRTPCEGAAGSLLPPLSVTQCTRNVLAQIPFALEKILSLGTFEDPYKRRIILPGIERVWVHQTYGNDCWAAAIEMARTYLGYRPFPQTSLIENAPRFCPRLTEQAEGGTPYQIAYMISANLETFDRTLTEPHFCPDAECIIASLQRRHPVIMLNQGHAVLLVGIEYTTRPVQTGGPLVIVQGLFVLDPMGPPYSIQELASTKLCSAGAFIAY